jgi:hypothetical protein
MPLQIRRGTSGSLPSTPAEGEPLFLTDTQELAVGTGSSRVLMAKKDHTHAIADVTNLQSSLNTRITSVNGLTTSNGGGVALTLDSLSDVNATTPANGQYLQFDGSNWVPVSGSGGNLDGLSDVVITSPVTNGQVLKYNGTNWVNGTDATGWGGLDSITLSTTNRLLGSPGDKSTGAEIALASQLAIGKVSSVDTLDIVLASSSGLEKSSGLKIAASGVTSGMLASNAVTTAKINAAAVTVAKISATGTADSTTFLRGDGAWAAPSGTGGVSEGDKGDINVTASGATWTIDPGAVTYAKIQNVSATDKILGRSSANAGIVEEITCTAAGRALLDDADAAAQRTTLGAAATSHTHAASAIDSGTLDIARIPTGTSGSQVALGNHTHAASAITSGTLAVANGGTNLSTAPSNGQLLIGNGTGYTLATLTQGSNVTITNSSGAITIGATGGSAFNPVTKVEVYSDFLGNSTVPWAPFTTGGTVGFTQPGGGQNTGAANMGTGTTATGRAAIGSQLQTAISLGNGAVTFSASHFLVGQLSNSTETYIEELGFLDSISGVFQNAVYFTYTDSLNGSRWQCICSDGLGSTTVDSGVAAVLEVYTRFEITVDATGSTAVFKIDGATVATISNNIPTGTNRTGVLVSKRKTNGTTLRQSRLDYLYFSQDVNR